jgi:multidrug efflux pump subunit AcrA (membrane-fusion protein)
MFKNISTYVALAGIAASVHLVRSQQVKPEPVAPLAEPVPSPYVRAIGGRGLIEGVDENVRASAAVPGLVARVAVKVGDKVREGDVLLELDARDALSQVEVQRANITAIEASILESEIALADREDQWDRMQRLKEGQVVSVDERQRTQFAFRAARSRVETRKADLAYAKAQLSRAEVLRDLLVVKAPRAGTVLQVNVRPGEYAAVPAADSLVLLGQIDRYQLRVDIDEDNAPRVITGCTAKAFLKGRREDPIALEFVRIEPFVQRKRSLAGDSNERVDTRVLQVIFQFPKPAVPVYVGQQLDVFIDG